MFHKCSDKCLCASTPGQPGGKETVLYCYGEVRLELINQLIVILSDTLASYKHILQSIIPQYVNSHTPTRQMSQHTNQEINYNTRFTKDAAIDMAIDLASSSW